MQIRLPLLIIDPKTFFITCLEDIAAIENCPIWLAWLDEWIDEEGENCDWGRWLSGKRKETDLEIKERIMLRTLYPTPTYQDGLVSKMIKSCPLW